MKYSFENDLTGEQWELQMSYDELQDYLKTLPLTTHQIFQMNLVDPFGIGVTKPPSDFQKHVLGRIRDSVPGARKEALEKRWSIPKEI